MALQPRWKKINRVRENKAKVEIEVAIATLLMTLGRKAHSILPNLPRSL